MKNSEINRLSDGELETLIAADECPYEPEQYLGAAIGMYHCPICSDMVVAGVPHPRGMRDVVQSDDKEG